MYRINKFLIIVLSFYTLEKIFQNETKIQQLQ